MADINSLKMKVMEKLEGYPLDGMSLYELGAYVDLIGRVAAIRERDELEKLTEALMDMSRPKAPGCFALGGDLSA